MEARWRVMPAAAVAAEAEAETEAEAEAAAEWLGVVVDVS